MTPRAPKQEMRIQVAPASFNATLNDLKRHVPLYAHMWRDLDFGKFDYGEPEQFARLPILRKSDLLAAPVSERLDHRFRGQRLTHDRTSGSTGQPLELLIDSRTKRRRSLRFLRALISAGYRPGQRLMLISSRPSSAIKHISPWARLAGWTYADLYLGQDELIREYERVHPDVVYGPLNALISLSEGLGKADDRSRGARAISTAEQLTPGARRQLESVFVKGVTDFYGSTELGLVAWRNAFCGHYMTFRDSHLLEFLPMAEIPGFERLIVTDLRPGAMPLIRYDTGDLVRRVPTADGYCIQEFIGREIDCLWLKNGTRVGPYAIDGILGNAAGVRQYRVVQQPDFTVEVSIATESVTVHDLQTTLHRQLADICPGLDIAIATVSEPALITSHKARAIQTLVRTPQ